MKQAETHPNSDLLAAFADKSLFGGERDRVLTHLASCQQCRACLLFVGSCQPRQELRSLRVTVPSAAVWCSLVLCVLLASYGVNRFKGMPKQAAIQTTSTEIAKAWLRNVSRTRLSSGLTYPRALAPVESQMRIVVQSERGERWLTLAKPVFRSLRN